MVINNTSPRISHTSTPSSQTLTIELFQKCQEIVLDHWLKWYRFVNFRCPKHIINQFWMEHNKKHDYWWINMGNVYILQRTIFFANESQIEVFGTFYIKYTFIPSEVSWTLIYFSPTGNTFHCVLKNNCFIQRMTSTTSCCVTDIF